LVTADRDRRAHRIAVFEQTRVSLVDSNRLAVGLGMIPRGEVGLIFADVGSKLEVDGHKVINKETFSAVVVMVMVTTMVTPPLLKWALSRDKETSDDSPPSEDSSA